MTPPACRSSGGLAASGPGQDRPGQRCLCWRKTWLPSAASASLAGGRRSRT